MPKKHKLKVRERFLVKYVGTAKLYTASLFEEFKKSWHDVASLST